MKLKTALSGLSALTLLYCTTDVAAQKIEPSQSIKYPQSIEELVQDRNLLFFSAHESSSSTVAAFSTPDLEKFTIIRFVNGKETYSIELENAVNVKVESTPDGKFDLIKSYNNDRQLFTEVLFVDQNGNKIREPIREYWNAIDDINVVNNRYVTLLSKIYDIKNRKDIKPRIPNKESGVTGGKTYQYYKVSDSGENIVAVVLGEIPIESFKQDTLYQDLKKRKRLFSSRTSGKDEFYLYDLETNEHIQVPTIRNNVDLIPLDGSFVLIEWNESATNDFYTSVIDLEGKVIEGPHILDFNPAEYKIDYKKVPGSKKYRFFGGMENSRSVIASEDLDLPVEFYSPFLSRFRLNEKPLSILVDVDLSEYKISGYKRERIEKSLEIPRLLPITFALGQNIVK